MAPTSATRKGALNARQLRFIDEYLIDMNATQAAIRAGYSKKTAAEQGYDLLRHPQIAPAIAAKRQELSHKAGITVEAVMNELRRIAFSDVRALYHDNGRLKMPHEMDDAAAAALASVETVEVSGADAPPLNVKKVRLWDKKAALETLLKHLGAAGPAQPDPAAATAPIVTALDALSERLAKLAS